MCNFNETMITKKQLALMYFPDTADPRIAVNHLGAWIKRCRGLTEKLLALGYRKSQKHFTPKQLQAIYDHLGEP